MKVNIDKTLEVTDEQRKAIARVIDGPDAKKRDATRDEMKAFIWDHGSGWEDALLGTPAIVPVTGSGAPTEETSGAEYLGHVDVTHDDAEDLIGGDDDDPMSLI